MRSLPENMGIGGSPDIVGPYAVLLIDMQTGFYRDLLPEVRIRLIANQQRVLRQCAIHDVPVVVIELRGYAFTFGELLQSLWDIPRVVSIGKSGADGFDGTDLDDVLQSFGARTLILMGIFASACVISTAKSAIARGYKLCICEGFIADELRRGIEDSGRAWFTSHSYFNQLPRFCLNALATDER